MVEVEFDIREGRKEGARPDGRKKADHQAWLYRDEDFSQACSPTLPAAHLAYLTALY